jgi:sugar O-acyltransferase (sialic acid O-acetyltransferase NeuD family)
MRRNSIYIYGTGGHANSIASLAEDLNLNVDGFISHNNASSSKHLRNVLSLEDVFQKGEQINCVIGVGMNFLREKISREMNAIFGDQVVFISLIHPSASVAKSTEINNGVIVLPGAHIGPHSKIGDHCLIGANSSLDHDSTMRNFSSLAPGSITGGNVDIGVRSALLIQSSVMHGINIGEDSLLAAASFLKDAVGDFEVWGGTPARILKKRSIDEPYL